MRKKYTVRCLGPNKEEHSFQSTDPIHLRICPECQIKIGRVVNISLRLDNSGRRICKKKPID